MAHDDIPATSVTETASVMTCMGSTLTLTYATTVEPSPVTYARDRIETHPDMLIAITRVKLHILAGRTGTDQFHANGALTHNRPDGGLC